MLTSLLTMLFTIWVYAQIYGASFAIGFVALLAIHEMGHYAAARQRGLNVSLPAFIPFIGAAINLREQPHNSETEAYVAFAGPFIGTLGALAAYLYGITGGGAFWVALSYTGFLLNLFNMLPISPLDGGRITQVLSPRIWFLGVPLLLALFWYQPSPILFLVLLLAAPSLMKAWRYDPNSPEARRYHDVPQGARIQYMVMYLGLTAFLAVMTYNTHVMMR
jgi:Zn-dependent protease